MLAWNFRGALSEYKVEISENPAISKLAPNPPTSPLKTENIKNKR
jgi:hypothetical protein